SKGAVAPTAAEKTNHQKVPAIWSDNEECVLVLYLQEQAAGARDGLNFLKEYFQGATQHVTEKFPMQCGGEKNASTCHTKWTNIHLSYLCHHHYS
ncbi:hypothetical protein SCLCIDRAFT_121138, partial [Scleroderma citrinum Foug A]